MDSMPPGSSRALKSRPFRERLGFALNGLRIVARRERSFRSQLVLAAAALAAAAGLNVSAVWWALLILSIGLVLALEAVNAAIEYLLDCLHPAIAAEIGAAKDAAAGAVLIASLVSGLVGAIMVIAHLS
jgi:diacylglycerol kinase (ATP)